MFSASPALFEKYAGRDDRGSRARPSRGQRGVGRGLTRPRHPLPGRAHKATTTSFNGEKMWTSHVAHADWGVVYARTGEQGDKRAISAFVVDADGPDWKNGPIGMLTAFSRMSCTSTTSRCPRPT